MLKSWLYLFIAIIIIILFIIFINIKSLVSVYIYIELFWMFFYMLSLLMAIFSDSIFFSILSFFILMFAAVDIIFFGLFLSIKIK